MILLFLIKSSCNTQKSEGDLVIPIPDFVTELDFSRSVSFAISLIFIAIVAFLVFWIKTASSRKIGSIILCVIGSYFALSHILCLIMTQSVTFISQETKMIIKLSCSIIFGMLSFVFNPVFRVHSGIILTYSFLYDIVLIAQIKGNISFISLSLLTIIGVVLISLKFPDIIDFILLAFLNPIIILTGFNFIFNRIFLILHSCVMSYWVSIGIRIAMVFSIIITFGLVYDPSIEKEYIKY